MSRFLYGAKDQANAALEFAKTKAVQQNNFLNLLNDAAALKNVKNQGEYDMMLNLIQALETDEEFLKKYYFSDTQNPIYVKTYHDVITLLKSIFPNQPAKIGGVKSRKNKRKGNKKTRKQLY